MLEAVALNAMSVGVTSWHGNDRWTHTTGPGGSNVVHFGSD